MQTRNSLNDYKLTSIRLTNFGFYVLSRVIKSLALNEFISNAIEDGMITLRSDGSPFRDFIGINDLLVACHKFSLIKNLPESVIFGSGLTVNLSYIASLVQSKLHSCLKM